MGEDARVSPSRTPAPDPVRTISDEERRTRLARRHAIAPAHRTTDAVAAARAVLAFHATEPATVYLSAFARVDGLTRDDVARALYDDRTLVKQLAMRRTLFAFPRPLLPAVMGSAAARVADQQRRQLARDLERFGGALDGTADVEAMAAEVVRLLGEGPSTAQELGASSELLALRLPMRPGVPDAPTMPVTPRLLTVLGAEGRVFRGSQSSGWRSSRPRWTLAEDWLGEVDAPLPETEGYAALVRAWLERFGPGTEEDLVWWFGATKAAVRGALADLAAVPVALEDDSVGWVLADDVEPEPAVDPWVALLPVLDPTTMGWKQRDFYLGPHRPHLFDSAGNAGTTAWWDGRVVGGWHHGPDGEVVVALLEDVPREVAAALDAEADRLTEWLAGEQVGTVYPSPLMRERTGAPGPTRRGTS